MAITYQQPFFPTCYGKKFTDRPFGPRRSTATGNHDFDRLCAEFGTEHRLTPPLHAGGKTERHVQRSRAATMIAAQ